MSASSVARRLRKTTDQHAGEILLMPDDERNWIVVKILDELSGCILLKGGAYYSLPGQNGRFVPTTSPDQGLAHILQHYITSHGG